MNKCIFIGRLTRDVEIRQLPNDKKVGKFGLAVDGRPFTRNGEVVKEPLFLDCEAWNRSAENLEKYFTKGKPISVVGELRLEQWDDKTTGQKRSKHMLHVLEWGFVPSDNANSNASAEGEADGDETVTTAPAKAPAKRSGKKQPAAVPEDDGGVPVEAGDDDSRIPF